MGHEDVKELIDYLKDTDITEVYVERDGVKIRIKREKFFAPAGAPQPLLVERNIIAEEAAAEQPVAEPAIKLFTVPSPLWAPSTGRPRLRPRLLSKWARESGKARCSAYSRQ